MKAATWRIRAVSVYGMSAHVCVAASLLAIEGLHLLELFQGFLGLFYCCLLGSGQAHHSDLRAWSMPKRMPLRCIQIPTIKIIRINEPKSKLHRRSAHLARDCSIWTLLVKTCKQAITSQHPCLCVASRSRLCQVHSGTFHRLPHGARCMASWKNAVSAVFSLFRLSEGKKQRRCSQDCRPTPSDTTHHGEMFWLSESVKVGHEMSQMQRNIGGGDPGDLCHNERCVGCSRFAMWKCGSGCKASGPVSCE